MRIEFLKDWALVNFKVFYYYVINNMTFFYCFRVKLRRSNTLNGRYDRPNSVAGDAPGSSSPGILSSLTSISSSNSSGYVFTYLNTPCRTHFYISGDLTIFSPLFWFWQFFIPLQSHFECLLGLQTCSGEHDPADSAANSASKSASTNSAST